MPEKTETQAEIATKTRTETRTRTRTKTNRYGEIICGRVPQWMREGIRRVAMEQGEAEAVILREALREYLALKGRTAGSAGGDSPR